MIGYKIIHKEIVDSTNNYMTNLVYDGKISHGMVILADKQTNGRGQRNATWQSKAKKNLLVSYYTQYKHLKITEQFLIAQYVSSAIHSYLCTLGINAEIKWPNDIIVNKKKICGVLIENQIQGQLIKGSIVGIGLNINQEDFEENSITSLKLLTKKEFDISKTLDELLLHLNRFFDMLTSQKVLLKNYYLNNLWLFEVKGNFRSKNEDFEGIIKGTDEYGRLKIEINQKIKIFDLKEIIFLDRNVI
jgi:BirA family transcriptional regulator, biotin operon repressor / biotin---[acetyl-CoA-carboxylase] ligase